ncbi:MAG TPA: hypothetical protein VKZ65_01950 [Glycomyces sp.]|nr:hypothetical protein [Glycomyces sp.]
MERPRGRTAPGAWSGRAILGRAAANAVMAAAAAFLLAAVLGQGGLVPFGAGEEAPAPYETRALEARPAVLLAEQVDEQLMLCRYKVNATFGVSVFSDTRMGAKRLVRLHDGEEIAGSCSAVEGGDTIGCAGLSWEHQWIRVGSGTTLGWSPASCFERIGMF